jgi:hypothetical protein
MPALADCSLNAVPENHYDCPNISAGNREAPSPCPSPARGEGRSLNGHSLLPLPSEGEGWGEGGATYSVGL